MISIITHFYNSQEHLSFAIESAFNQSYPHWELLLINDGSTDNSKAISLSFNDSGICYFAGKWENNSKEQFLGKYDNLFFSGTLKSSELTSFYKKLDLLLVTYNYHKYAEQLSNPHKMMGYLSSGKMVLATWTSEYKVLHDQKLILMAKNSQEFLFNFTKVIKELDDWNSTKKQDARREFANSNTYDKQIDRIEKLIYS